jgi:hypothetical protein
MLYLFNQTYAPIIFYGWLFIVGRDGPASLAALHDRKFCFLSLFFDCTEISDLPQLLFLGYLGLFNY